MIEKAQKQVQSKPCDQDAECELSPVEPSEPVLRDENLEIEALPCEANSQCKMHSIRPECHCEPDLMEPTSPEVWDASPEGEAQEKEEVSDIEPELF